MRLPGVLLSAALLLPLPLAAQATNYTYNGPGFNVFSAPVGGSQVFTASDFVSVDFTLSAPLQDNLTEQTAITTSFTISDGYETFSSLTAASIVFELETNASGVITGWDILAENANGDSAQTLYVPGDEGIDTAVYSDTSAVAHVYNFSRTSPQGTWAVTTVPESSSPLYGLISTAALAFGFVVRRRLVIAPSL